jgi:hypothetical protein
VLDNPQPIIKAIEKQRNEADKLGALKSELHQLEKKAKAINREQGSYYSGL